MAYSRFESFEQACREWLNSLLRALHFRGSIYRTCDEFWIRDTPDTMHRTCRERYVYEPKAVGEIFAVLREWHGVLTAFATEPAFAQYRGKYVGPQPALFPFTADAIAMGMLPVDDTYNTPVDSLQFDEKQFKDRMLAIQQFIDEPTIDFEYCTPLWNFNCQKSFELEEGVSIELLTDDVLRHSLQMGVILGDPPSGRTFGTRPHTKWGLYRRLKLPKIVRQTLPAPGDPPDRLSEICLNDANHFAEALALTKNGELRIGGTFQHAPRGWPVRFSGFTFGGWAERSLSHGTLTDSPVDISTGEGTAIRCAWENLGATNRAESVSLALRRLRFALQRRRPDDRILDLAIACEALFLPEDDDKRELNFKVALHAAHYLADGETERTEIFETVRQSYAARSIVAHGKDLSHWATSQGVNVDRMILRLIEIVRTSIYKRLGFAGEYIDWTGVVLGL